MKTCDKTERRTLRYWHGQGHKVYISIAQLIKSNFCDQNNCASEAFAAATAKSLQSCPTLCGPIDSSPPGSSVPGIMEARTLEWLAISFSEAFIYPKINAG